VIENGKVPAAGAVPLNAPADVKLSQIGKFELLQLIGAIPPADVKLIVNGAPTVSASDGLVVIVSGSATRMLNCLEAVSGGVAESET
jgi:hypothetical protein